MARSRNSVGRCCCGTCYPPCVYLDETWTHPTPQPPDAPDPPSYWEQVAGVWQLEDAAGDWTEHVSGTTAHGKLIHTLDNPYDVDGQAISTKVRVGGPGAKPRLIVGYADTASDYYYAEYTLPDPDDPEPCVRLDIGKATPGGDLLLESAEFEVTAEQIAQHTAATYWSYQLCYDPDPADENYGAGESGTLSAYLEVGPGIGHRIWSKNHPSPPGRRAGLAIGSVTGGRVDYDKTKIATTDTRANTTDCLVNSDPFNRQAIGDEWTVQAGQWGVDGTALYTTTGGALITDNKPNPAGPEHYVEVDIYAHLAGSSGRIVVGYKDADNYLFVSVTFGPAGTAKLELGKVKAGTETILATRILPDLALQVWHKVKACYCGGTLVGLVQIAGDAADEHKEKATGDGTLPLEAPGSTVGLATAGDVGYSLRFDNYEHHKHAKGEASTCPSCDPPECGCGNFDVRCAHFGDQFLGPAGTFIGCAWTETAGEWYRHPGTIYTDDSNAKAMADAPADDNATATTVQTTIEVNAEGGIGRVYTADDVYAETGYDAATNTKHVAIGHGGTELQRYENVGVHPDRPIVVKVCLKDDLLLGSFGDSSFGAGNTLFAKLGSKPPPGKAGVGTGTMPAAGRVTFSEFSAIAPVKDGEPCPGGCPIPCCNGETPPRTMTVELQGFEHDFEFLDGTYVLELRELVGNNCQWQWSSPSNACGGSTSIRLTTYQPGFNVYPLLEVIASCAAPGVLIRRNGPALGDIGPGNCEDFDFTISLQGLYLDEFPTGKVTPGT